jgi:hypothetical protein
VQLLERERVVGPVGRVHAAHAEDRGPLLVGLGHCLCLAQPLVGGATPPGLHLDESQLAHREHRGRSLSGLIGDQERFVQDDRALLVTAADSRARARRRGRQRPGLQRLVVALHGRRSCLP